MIQNNNLEKVIECLQQQQKHNLSKSVPSQDIGKIHHFTIDLLDKFNQHINRCKKYNEARIHRKYQTTMSFLQQQNRDLKAKVLLLRQSIPSSQKYVSDLIDRMVQLRNINQKLKKENQNLIMRTSVQNPLETKNSQSYNPMEQSFQKKIIYQAIQKFKKNKKQSRNKLSKQMSNLEKFLQFNNHKMKNWNLTDLFERLQKWISNLKDIRLIDSERLKQNIQRTYTTIQRSYIDTNHNTINYPYNDQKTIYLSKVKTDHTRLVANPIIALKRNKINNINLSKNQLRREISCRSQMKMGVY